MPSREHLPRGVQNPEIIDLITFDADSGEVVLVMIERRHWSSDASRLLELDAKLNAYFTYVLDGHLVAQYPQYAGRPVRIQLDCAEPPGGEVLPVLHAAGTIGARHGLRFVTRVMEDPGEGRAPWESPPEG